jgi:hypothetical protein
MDPWSVGSINMQCTAHSSRTGQACKRQAIAGGNVCIMHGGSAAQVRRAAALRILALVDPALANLAKDLRSKDDAMRQKATFDVLDRAGLKAIDRLQLLDPRHDDIDLTQLSAEQLEALQAIAVQIDAVKNAAT